MPIVPHPATARALIDAGRLALALTLPLRLRRPCRRRDHGDAKYRRVAFLKQTTAHCTVFSRSWGLERKLVCRDSITCHSRKWLGRFLRSRRRRGGSSSGSYGGARGRRWECELLRGTRSPVALRWSLRRLVDEVPGCTAGVCGRALSGGTRRLSRGGGLYFFTGSKKRKETNKTSRRKIDKQTNIYSTDIQIVLLNTLYCTVLNSTRQRRTMLKYYLTRQTAQTSLGIWKTVPSPCTVLYCTGYCERMNECVHVLVS